MAIPSSIFVVLLLYTNLLQGLVAAFSQDEKLAVKRRLNLLNKPAVKSFQTEYGDIVDCVEINKQLAFDHPLLKNHSIQMKPRVKIMSKQAKLHESSYLRQILLKIKCPRGTVAIKRIQEEELIAMERYRPSMGMKMDDDQAPPTEHVATIVAFTKNYGVQGQINTWSPEVKSDYQFSSASIFVASDDGPVSNAISAGWSVNPHLYRNFTHLNTFWTKDSAKTTGCFNVMCPGFVQTSKQIPLGLVLKPVSQYDGQQHYIDVVILQDIYTNWWLKVQGQPIGYWPMDLFSTLTQGATRAGWGGEVSSPLDLETPAMGSGHFPIEGHGKASFIAYMGIADTSPTWIAPSTDYLKQDLSNPSCYNTSYDGTGHPEWGHYMFFGGPPDCKL